MQLSLSLSPHFEGLFPLFCESGSRMRDNGTDGPHLLPLDLSRGDGSRPCVPPPHTGLSKPPWEPLCSRPRPFPRHPGRSAPGQPPQLRGLRTEGQTPPRCALAEPGKPPWSAESPASTGDGDPCSLEGELALRPSPPATRSHGEQEGDSVPPVLNRSCRTSGFISSQQPSPPRAAAPPLTPHAWGLRGWLSPSLHIHSLIEHLPKA